MHQWSVKWAINAKKQPFIKARSPNMQKVEVGGNVHLFTKAKPTNVHKIDMGAPILGWIIASGKDIVSGKHTVSKKDSAMPQAKMHFLARK